MPDLHHKDRPTDPHPRGWWSINCKCGRQITGPDRDAVVRASYRCPEADSVIEDERDRYVRNNERWKALDGLIAAIDKEGDDA